MELLRLLSELEIGQTVTGKKFNELFSTKKFYEISFDIKHVERHQSGINYSIRINDQYNFEENYSYITDVTNLPYILEETFDENGDLLTQLLARVIIPNDANVSIEKSNSGVDVIYCIDKAVICDWVEVKNIEEWNDKDFCEHALHIDPKLNKYIVKNEDSNGYDDNDNDSAYSIDADECFDYIDGSVGVCC